MINCVQINIVKENSVTLKLISSVGLSTSENVEYIKEDLYINCVKAKYDSFVYADFESIIPISLIENKDYFFELSFKNPKHITCPDNFQIQQKNDTETEYFIRFNSRNYVGILNLAEFGIFTSLIEVKSKKINYELEYSLLLKKISELGIDLTTRASSYFESPSLLSEEIQNDENILSSKYTYLRSVIISGELESLYYSFIRKPLKRIIDEKQTTFSWESSELDLDSYIENISKIAIKDVDNNIYPLEMDSRTYDDTVDTIENQFIKFLLEYIINYLEHAASYISFHSSHSTLLIELKECLTRCESILSTPIFRQISKLRYFPTKSNVLQQQYPYRELYQLYWLLARKIEISDSLLLSSMKTPQKDLPKLYEYWCFLSFIDLLNARYNEIDIIEQSLVKYNDKQLCYNISPDKSHLTYNISEKKLLKLYYNKEYSNLNYIYRGRSYSHPLNPDISLELFIMDKLVAILHFDAKYRLENMQSFKLEDLDKMHTYKDGILGTIGAYILYPGEDTANFIQEEKDVTLVNPYFPSVGAFKYNIGDKLNIDDERTEVIKLIDNFVDIDNYIASKGIFSEDIKQMNYIKRLLE